MLTEAEQLKYQELKAKSVWLRGSSEDKAEYQRLKVLASEVLLAPIATPSSEGLKAADQPISQEESITLSKTQYEGLIDRLDKLEQEKLTLPKKEIGIGEWTKDDQKPRQKLISLKLYTPEGTTDKYPIVARDITVYKIEVVDGKDTKVPYTRLTCLLPDGGHLTQEMRLTEYANIADRIWGEVVEENVEKLKQLAGKTASGGIFGRKIHDADNYKSIPGQPVNMFVTAESRTFKLKLSDGRLVKIKENVANGS